MLYRQSFNRCILFILIMLGSSLPGQAGAATVHTTDFIADGTRTNFNGFEGMPSSSSYGSTYTEDGITVTQVNGQSNDIDTECNNGCFSGGVDGNRSWYPDGGDFGYTSISQSGGSNFANVGFVTGSGFGASTTYLLYALVSGGSVVQSGTINRTVSHERGYLGFSGGGFDTILLRDSISSNATMFDGSFNAFALDSIEMAEISAVPVPAAVWLFGTALIGFVGLSRRRKVA